MPTPAKIIDQNLPTVALVGRVNVGKSTLFNRLTEKQTALVSDIPGTTRTRNIGLVKWRGKNFRLVDTGGLTFDTNVPLEKEIIVQTKIGIAEADLILFITDIQAGILPQEKELIKMLNNHRQQLIFVANKADSRQWYNSVHEHEFLKLGLGEPLAVSAANGANLGELLEMITKQLNKLPKRPKQIKELKPIKVALIGKPNVGKSTLFNSLIGKQEVVVSDRPHTTREPFDTLVKYEKQPILFVDTAAIRRKTKVSGKLEVQGISKSIQMITKADVVLLVVDTTEPISSQDQQLGGLLKEHSRSVIIIINKWDMAEANDDHFRNQVKELVYNFFPHLKFAPLLFISAKSQYRVQQIFPEIIKAYQARFTEITNNALDRFLQQLIKKHLPSRGKGVNFPEILSLKQLATDPPIFQITVKAKTSLNSSYVQFIKNELRIKFNFYATPIVVKIKKHKK